MFHQTPGVSHSHPTPGKLQLPNPSWVKVPRRPLFGRTLYRRVHSRRLHGGERTGLGRDGTDVQRVEVGVVRRGVPAAPASVPGLGPELLVRRERVHHGCVRIAPLAVAGAPLPVVGVDAVIAVEVEQGVRPVAGLVQPVELGVVVWNGAQRRWEWGATTVLDKGPRSG